MNHLVIMAGGVGSRVWPMSTDEYPKQFVDFMGVGRTLLQLTYDRFAPVVSADNVWVVTNERYAAIVHEQLPAIPEGNILREPCRRNTAPCIAYAAYRIKAKDQQACIAVTPADAIVMDTAEFQRVITAALQFAAETDGIVTLGMKPTRPETGYGYIQADLAAQSARNKEVFRVSQFKEKPDLDTARRYVSQNHYFWNAGIFVWSVETIVNALRLYQPRLAAVFEKMSDVYGTPAEQDTVNARYPDCENISIDYAVMEQAEEIYVLPANFGWSDLGTWGSLYSLTRHDANGNSILSSGVRTYDTAGCIINVESAREVVVQGLRDFIVAERDGRLLICRLDDEQQIKQMAKPEDNK